MITGIKRTTPEERLSGSVVVGNVEVDIERDRMRDRKVMGLVALSRMGAVRREPPEHERDDHDQPATTRHGARILHGPHMALGCCWIMPT